MMSEGGATMINDVCEISEELKFEEVFSLIEDLRTLIEKDFPDLDSIPASKIGKFVAEMNSEIVALFNNDWCNAPKDLEALTGALEPDEVFHKPFPSRTNFKHGDPDWMEGEHFSYVGEKNKESFLDHLDWIEQELQQVLSERIESKTPNETVGK